jgi:hypothetical protein
MRTDGPPCGREHEGSMKAEVRTLPTNMRDTAHAAARLH